MRLAVAFRVDASIEIGAGHVMRCLTLADSLTVRNAQCEFICRAHDGNLIKLIRAKGYPVHVLDATQPHTPSGLLPNQLPSTAHSHWLGATQEQDAAACRQITAALKPSWIIVDHYALDYRWESALATNCHKLMVIDDLADRRHTCDLLLDQTFGRSSQDYSALVQANTVILCGSQYALLRPEFTCLRPSSLVRRRNLLHARNLLVTMGGVDKDNINSLILQTLRGATLPPTCRITVVVGGSSVHVDELRLTASSMPWDTRILCDVSNMASLIADSDLIIGAAGATSWERCCLGAPTIIVAVADNQAYAARRLNEAHAVHLLTLGPSFGTNLISHLSMLLNSRERLKRLSENASKITDGKGCDRVIGRMKLGARK